MMLPAWLWRFLETREHRQDTVAIHAQVMVGSAGNGSDLVEMIAFHPILQLSGTIARVGAGFEHGHDDHLDRDRRVLGHGGAEDSEKQEQRDVTSHSGFQFSLADQVLLNEEKKWLIWQTLGE